jgi:hypothetical protein
MTNDKPNLSKTLFWDVDYEAIAWDEKWQFVIERVLERGSLEDWKTIKAYYGLSKIKEAALTARWLDATTLSFCCNYFHLPKETFRCYTQKSLNPAPWIF